MKNQLEYLVLSLLLPLFALTSCKKETIPEPVPVPIYSFFVAGHTYGSPVNAPSNYGLHPPFIEQFDWLNEQEPLQFGVLTGDVVRLAEEKSWDIVFDELTGLDVPFHVAPGNHDVNDRAIFEQYFPDSYYAFQEDEDLFIILDPNLDDWNISGDQLTFVENELNNAANYRHIFVFFHQLIWWTEEAPWNKSRPNSFQNMSEDLNFHSKILPLLKGLENEVFLFAGDVGAVSHSPAICYLQQDNVSFIASGMGVDEKDNFLIVEIAGNGEVSFQLIGLKCQNSVNCLGQLEDY